MKFAKLSETNRWRDVAYLTMDQEWSPDEVLEDALKIIGDTPLTLFVTHDTPLIKELTKRPNVELGIHPNFCVRENIIDATIPWPKQMIPAPKCARSHTLATSTRILKSLKDSGIEVDSSTYVPLLSGSDLRPFTRHGLIVMPICWEDDIELETKTLGEIRNIRFYPGVKVVNFHPIHVYINTSSQQHYAKAKVHYKDPAKLLEFRGGGYGARDALRDLLAQ